MSLQSHPAVTAPTCGIAFGCLGSSRIWLHRVAGFLPASSGSAPAPGWRAQAAVQATDPSRRRVTVPSAAPTSRRPAGTLYRGREGMWSWVAHRVTGVLIFFFLFVHVLDTALVRVSPEAYNTVIESYKNPVMNLMEVGLV